MQKNSEALVRRVLSGDQSAYEQLVEAHKGRVFAQVVGRIGNFAAAEDVVQNAFVEAYVNLASLQAPEKFPAWLRGIAVNLSNKWLQRQRPSVPIESVENDVSKGQVIPLPDEVFEKGETQDAVLVAVEGLPDIYREVVLLHYMEGMTYPEIAAFLEVPESTVTGRLQVARNRLRDDLMPLIEDTLQEKCPSSKLTRKVMSALPPLLYATATTEASAFAKLKGSAMVKMIGFLCAGMIGTGVYFGGISAMVNQVSGSSELEPDQVELVEAPASMVDDNGTQKQFRIETQEDGQRVQETGVSDSESQDDSLSKRFLLTTPEGRATVQEMAVLAQASDKNKAESGDQQKVEKAGFKIKTTSKDSLITLTFWLPESADESVLVDMTMYNLMGNAVAKPVRKAYSAGTYTVTQTKRGIPDGMYFISMKVNQEPIVNRKMNLVWEDRK